MSGEVKGIELSDDAATIHYAFTRKDLYYSIVDWKDGTFKIRSSTSDSKLGHTIAAAGLYEIEELVADEISPIAIESEQKGTVRVTLPKLREMAQYKIVQGKEKSKIRGSCSLNFLAQIGV